MSSLANLGLQVFRARQKARVGCGCNAANVGSRSGFGANASPFIPPSVTPGDPRANMSWDWVPGKGFVWYPKNPTINIRNKPPSTIVSGRAGSFVSGIGSRAGSFISGVGARAGSFVSGIVGSTSRFRGGKSPTIVGGVMNPLGKASLFDPIDDFFMASSFDAPTVWGYPVDPPADFVKGYTDPGRASEIWSAQRIGFQSGVTRATVVGALAAIGAGFIGWHMKAGTFGEGMSK